MTDLIATYTVSFVMHVIVSIVILIPIVISVWAFCALNYFILVVILDKDDADNLEPVMLIIGVIETIGLLIYNLKETEGSFTRNFDPEQLGSTFGFSLVLLIPAGILLLSVAIALIDKLAGKAVKKIHNGTRKAFKGNTVGLIQEDIEYIVVHKYPTNRNVYDKGILYYRAYLADKGKYTYTTPALTRGYDEDVRDPDEMYGKIKKELPNYDLGVIIATTIKNLFPSFVPLVTQYKETPSDELLSEIKDIISEVTLKEYTDVLDSVTNLENIEELALRTTVAELKTKSQEDLEWFRKNVK